MSTSSSSTTTTTFLTAIKYLAYTLPTFSKRFSRQTVWGRYIHELIHFEIFYKKNNRDWQNLELILHFLITFLESLWSYLALYSRWPNLISSQERGKTYVRTLHAHMHARRPSLLSPFPRLHAISPNWRNFSHAHALSSTLMIVCCSVIVGTWLGCCLFCYSD